jgi:NADH:ubiquinone oxidoreductase subunit 6 (subunit J)
MILEIALLCGLVIFSAAAIIFRDLLRAAICLAVASLLLGIVYFRMQAPYIGVFEISVVAGMITVLFIVTIALTKTGGDVREARVAAWIFPLALVLFLVVDILIARSLMGKIPALESAPEQGTLGEVLWKLRTLDLVGQIGIIFAGVLGVLALFRKRSKDE